MLVVVGNDQAGSLDGVTFGHEEQAPKVRKPYTITKQRERWTEEEHKKFLEAIKLHGRAWRRIQDHIGTKTAVQIRSHAQKYFSKVVRESSAAEGEEEQEEEDEEQEPAFKLADIPPPRPKRKPSHPYPRKLRASQLLPPNLEEQPCGPSARSQSPAVVMQESGSPTSVLSSAAEVSDTTGTLSLGSNALHHCASTSSFNNASSRTDMSALTELRNTRPQLSSSVERETGSTSPCSGDSTAFTLSLDNNATMKHQGNTPNEDTAVEKPRTKKCLKLFGKTVVVENLHKGSQTGTTAKQPQESSLGQSLSQEDVMDLDKEPQAVAGAGPEPELKGVCGQHQNSPVLHGTHHSLPPPPMFFYLPVPTERVENASQHLPNYTNPMVPWLAFYGGMPLPYHCAWEPSRVSGRNGEPDEQEVPKEEGEEQEEEEEGGSSEGSNSPTSDSGSGRNVNCSVVNSGTQEISTSNIISGPRPPRPSYKKLKGFVPYKKEVLTPSSTEDQLGVTA